MKSKLGVLLILIVIASAGISTSYACSFGRLPYHSYCYSNQNAIGMMAVGTNDPGPRYLSYYESEIQGVLYPDGPFPNCRTLNAEGTGTWDHQYGLGSNREGKNVACTNIKNEGDPLGSINIDEDEYLESYYSEARITIDNAYPWYATNFTVLIGNWDSQFPIRLYFSYFNYYDYAGDMMLLSALRIHGYTLTFHRNDGTIDQIKEEDLDVSFLDIDTLFPPNIRLESNEYLYLTIDMHFCEEIVMYHQTTLMPQSSSVSFSFVMFWAQTY